MASRPKTCAACSAPLGPGNRSGYCAAHVHSSPEYRRKMSETIRAGHLVHPEWREHRRKAGRASARAPGERERRSRDARERRIWEHSAEKSEATRAKISIGVSNARLAWCPPHLREQYRHLVKYKRIPSAEARRIILEQHETEMNRWRRSVEPAAKPAPIPVPANTGEDFPQRAVRVAALWAGASPSELLADHRLSRLVWARFAVMLALRRGGMKQPTIAKHLRRDKKTVAHGLSRAELLVSTHPDFAALYREVVAA